MQKETFSQPYRRMILPRSVNGQRAKANKNGGFNVYNLFVSQQTIGQNVTASRR